MGTLYPYKKSIILNGESWKSPPPLTVCCFVRIHILWKEVPF